MISEYAGSCYVFIKTNTVSLHATIIDTIEKEYLPQTVYTPVTNGYVISRSGCGCCLYIEGPRFFTGNSLRTTGLDSPVYRIFGDLKFVTDLGVFGGAESKNRIRFCPSGQD